MCPEKCFHPDSYRGKFWLLGKKDYETLNQLGDEIENSALSLNKLTDNLLNWALMQKNIMPYHPLHIPVEEVVKDVFSLFGNIATEKNFDLRSDVSDELEVYAENNSLHSIVRNLVDNALKYTPGDGEVNIFATENKEGITINIQDTGIGISNEKLPDIFLLQKDKSEPGIEEKRVLDLAYI